MEVRYIIPDGFFEYFTIVLLLVSIIGSMLWKSAAGLKLSICCKALALVVLTVPLVISFPVIVIIIALLGILISLIADVVRLDDMQPWKQ